MIHYSGQTTSLRASSEQLSGSTSVDTIILNPDKLVFGADTVVFGL